MTTDSHPLAATCRGWLFVACGTALLLLTSCSASASSTTIDPVGVVDAQDVTTPADDQPTQPAAATDAEDAAPEKADQVAEGGSDEPDADAVENEPAEHEPETPAALTDGPLAIPELDVPIIGVTSPLAGGGPRPVLAWLPVEGAVGYELSLFAPSGEIYWAWSGTTESIPVGGEPLLGPNSAGPAVIPGMSWYVLAIDDQGLIVGQSPQVAVAP